MSLPTIAFLDRATIPAQISLPTLPFDHHWIEYDFTARDQVVDRLQGIDIVITNKVVIDQAILRQLPDLKMIAVAATGFNNIDVAACAEQGVAVANVQGYATQSVPEHVIAMIFALKRNLMAYHNDIAKGEWQRHKQFCFFNQSIGDVAGSTLVVVGSGALGQATATLARAVGMKVIFAERKGEQVCREGFVNFEQALSQADVVSLHCPLNENTQNLISEPELSLMKPSAILINTGRGGLVDEVALVEALTQGLIGAAGVDVFTQEPADITNPLLDNALLPNLLLTPHVAWGSDSSIQNLTHILIDNITAYVAGREQNRVV